MTYKHIITTLLISAITLALTACAGSSGDSSSSTPQPKFIITLPETAPEQVRVSSTLPQELRARITNGHITILITSSNGYISQRNVTMDPNGRIRADFEVPAGGEYSITIELRDQTGSLIARQAQNANTNKTAALNITNPLVGIPRAGRATLIWDNLVTADTFLIEITPEHRQRQQIDGAHAGTQSTHTLTGLADGTFYSFTIKALDPSGTVNLATYRVAITIGLNSDNDTKADAVDSDDDNDGLPDISDNCPTVANPDQANTITRDDAEGDACDDPDGDMVYDISDNCPHAANPTQANNYGDLSNRTGTGDACEDTDNDGRIDSSDNCPTVDNPHQYNNDTDRYGDACDLDDDNDAIPDFYANGTAYDNCPLIANANQYNNDSDPHGDACDLDDDNDGTPDISDAFPYNATEQTDTDGDRIGDNSDNCPALANPDQSNRYGTAAGDVCEDSDGDGLLDSRDNCPIDYNPAQANLDGEGNADACDPLTPIANVATLQAITNGNYRLETDLTVTGSWTPISDFRGALNGNNHTITFRQHATHPLIGRIAHGATVINIGILGNTLARDNHGNISYAYATGNSYTRHSYTFSGGLVGHNSQRGTISNSYATGNSTCTGTNCFSGGLVGYHAGPITASYAAGNSTCTGSSYCGSGGLVGQNDYRGTITSSYRVQSSRSNTFGIHRTLAQLRCPTAPGHTCEGNTTYSGWDDAIWDFGLSSQLPTLADAPYCPSGNATDISCRW